MDQKSYVKTVCVNQGGNTIETEIKLDFADLKKILTIDGGLKFFKFYRLWGEMGLFKKPETVKKPTKNDKYRRVPKKGAGISESALRVLIAIGCHAKFKTGICDEPQGSLYDFVGLTQQSFIRGAKELQKKGVISYTPGNRWRSPIYVIIPPVVTDQLTPELIEETHQLTPELTDKRSINPGVNREGYQLTPALTPLDINTRDINTTTTTGTVDENRSSCSIFDDDYLMQTYGTRLGEVMGNEYSQEQNAREMTKIINDLEYRFTQKAPSADYSRSQMAADVIRYSVKDIRWAIQRCNERTFCWLGLRTKLEKFQIRPTLAEMEGIKADENIIKF